jgi:hypothetical protein
VRLDVEPDCGVFAGVAWLRKLLRCGDE